MFKAAVLDIDTIVGVIVQANVQSAKLPFPIRGTKRKIAIHKKRFDARLIVFVITRGAQSTILEVLGGLGALDRFLMPVECFDSRMSGDRVTPSSTARYKGPNWSRMDWSAETKTGASKF